MIALSILEIVSNAASPMIMRSHERRDMGDT